MAIMKLNHMAAEPVYKDKVVFITVNCDECVLVTPLPRPASNNVDASCPIRVVTPPHMTKLGATLALDERK